MISYSSEKITHKDVLFMFGIISWQVYLRILEKIAENDTTGVLAEFAAVVESGNGVVEFMMGFLDFLSSLLTLFYSGKSQEMPADVAENALVVAKKLGERTLILLIDILAETVRKIKQAGNQAFVAELALIRLSKVEQLKSVDKIISYLQSNAGRNSVAAAAQTQATASPAKKVETPQPKVAPKKAAVSAEVLPEKKPEPIKMKVEKKSEPVEDEAIQAKKQRKELTQSEFDAALPELNALLKDNDFGVYLLHFFDEYPKKILAGNVLQIEFPNKFEQSSFERDSSTFIKLLSNFFDVDLQLSVKVSASAKSAKSSEQEQSKQAEEEVDLAEIAKDEKVAEFIEKIDGEIVQ